MKLGSLLYDGCRHRSVKSEPCTAGEQEISFPANKERIKLWNSTVNRYRWIIMNVYIARNNIQVQFVRLRKKILPLFTFSESTDSKQYRPQNA